MKKILLISTLGVAIFLSACSQQLPDNTEEKDDKISQPEQQIDQVKEENQDLNKIIDKISLYCAEYNIPKCLPITSYSVVDLGTKYSVIKINNPNYNSNYLLRKKDGEWSVRIASQEENICETGSDSPDLIKYCNQ